METAIFSTLGLLFVTTLSGLSYLAVKHPPTYIKYGRYLVFSLAALALASFAFSWGARYAILVAARPLLRADALAEANALASRIDNLNAAIAFGALVLIALFTLLAKIGLHIDEDRGGADNENR